jgi:endonuclease YncB( thermonuclease family)
MKSLLGKLISNYHKSSIKYRRLIRKEKIIGWLIAIAILFIPIIGAIWLLPFVFLGTFAIIREIRDRGNNRIVSSVGGLVAIILLFVVGILPVSFANPTTKNTNPTVVEEKKSEETEIPPEALSEGINLPITSNNNEGAKQEAPQNTELYTVASVVDGDTAKLIINGKSESIRIIGLDTPETVDPRKPVQCFGKEASAKAKDLLDGQKVRIEVDSSQGDRDKYDRLLRYIILPDGRNFSKVMIEDGYAFEYTYNIPYKYQAEFKEAQRVAREQNRGLWSSNTCNGESKEALTPIIVPPVPKENTPPTSSTNTESASEVVKKSTNDICHAPGTTYYDRTKNFTPYETLEECLDSGGRMPER